MNAWLALVLVVVFPIVFVLVVWYWPYKRRGKK